MTFNSPLRFSWAGIHPCDTPPKDCARPYVCIWSNAFTSGECFLCLHSCTHLCAVAYVCTSTKYNHPSRCWTKSDITCQSNTTAHPVSHRMKRTPDTPLLLTNRIQPPLSCFLNSVSYSQITCCVCVYGSLAHYDCVGVHVRWTVAAQSSEYACMPRAHCHCRCLCRLGVCNVGDTWVWLHVCVGTNAHTPGPRQSIKMTITPTMALSTSGEDIYEEPATVALRGHLLPEVAEDSEEDLAHADRSCVEPLAEDENEENPYLMPVTVRCTQIHTSTVHCAAVCQSGSPKSTRPYQALCCGVLVHESAGACVCMDVEMGGWHGCIWVVFSIWMDDMDAAGVVFIWVGYTFIRSMSADSIGRIWVGDM